jgi:hypothetical protein
MRTLRFVALILVLIVIAANSGTTTAKVQGATGSAPSGSIERATLCPDIDAPVVCDNGKTYPNQCTACCAGAHNCVPAGQYPL